jgi:predicted transcriptional regulator of viral defense system
MPAAPSATFWLLMDRWHVPDHQALKLIGFEGKPRRRFKLTSEQARTLSALLAIDSALELAGMDRAWLHSRCSRLHRRTPLERIQAGAADAVFRVLAKEALAASMGQSAR